MNGNTHLAGIHSLSRALKMEVLKCERAMNSYAVETPKQESARLLNFLAVMPRGNCMATSAAVVREIMLQTGGRMMVCGEMYDIQSQSFPGGVYRMTLSREVFS